MNITRGTLRLGLLFTLVVGGLALPAANADGADTTVPAIIQDGFKIWAAKDASYAFDVWKKGGLLETDAKPAKLARYFGQMDRLLGNYRSYEIVQSKSISGSSRIIYLSINFEHAAAYGRFHVYQTDKGWVVQNMDFSTRPEAVMPWLAFAAEDTANDQ